MPLEPLIAHPLPAAPAFTGREAELNALREFWGRPNGVLSLVGLGGAGKTALAQEFVERILPRDPPDTLVVWSFYDEPDANAFLQASWRYLTGDATGDARGAGWFHLLKEALSDGRRHLFVLDGLERVQHQHTDATGIYGEMEDPLLRGFLSRIAAGTGRAKAIITTRFPVADVERWRDRGYTLIDVDALTRDSARRLLRSHGVRGDDAVLDRLTDLYGGHALTLDLLGGALSRFFGASSVPVLEPAAPAEEGISPQEARLAAVLRLYERHLPKAELALLCRLCIFRFGVDAEALWSIFLAPGREAVAGDMVGLSASALEAGLANLVAAHLTLRDQRGRFTIHPAVRDHFYRLFREPAILHEAVREHYSSLTSRPGIGLPSDKATLDLLEELIYHAIHSGNVAEAVEVYRHRLGGNDHLNAHLGEYVRTHRILRAFRECPDPSAMYHCLRAFGRFAEALQWRPRNSYIRLLSGELAPLREDRADATRRFAQFLQGEPVEIPDRSPDMPITAASLHLLKGAVDEARRVAATEKEVSLYQDDRVRNDMALAEAARREGRLDQCRELLTAASSWVLNSGSQEHLACLHLARARLAIDEGSVRAARAALDEGLHTSEECGFGLLTVDLLCEKARLAMQCAEWVSAEEAARRSIGIAAEAVCRYAWGEAQARHLLGEALAGQGRYAEAVEAYAGALAIRRRIGDHAAMATERAMRAAAARLPDAPAGN